MLRLGGGSIDDEADRGDRVDEVSTKGASLEGDSVMGASLNVSDLLDGCAIVGTCTLQK